MAELIKGDPSALVFTVPPLTAGRYRVEVRAAVHGNSEARSGLLDAEPTVA